MGLIRGILFYFLLPVALVWMALSAGLAFAMRQPPAVFGRVMAHTPWPAFVVLPFETLWMRARAGALDVGSAAPGFTLPTADHSSKVDLAALRGRPVMLVFGSYT